MEPVNPPQTVSVSTATLAKIVIFGLALWFFYAIRDVIALIFLAFMWASILNPLASWFQKHRMNRGLSVFFIYVALLALAASLAVSLAPAALREGHELIANSDTIWGGLLDRLGPVGDYIEKSGLTDNLNNFLGATFGGTSAAAGKLVATARGISHAAFSVVIVFVLAFYLVVSDDALKRLFRAVAPERFQPYLVDLFLRIERSLGAWARAQLLLSAIVGTAVYIMLLCLGVPYALVLAVVAGLAECVPYVGPIVAAIPAVVVALTHSPLTALLAAVGYGVIHLTETHIVVPRVMQRVTGLHPVVSIFSLLVGVKVAGPVGAILAIPAATALSVIIGDAFRLFKERESL